MDRTQSLIKLFCQSFPEIDRRVVKATVIEYGEDIESTIIDLVDISYEKKDISFIDHLKVQSYSVLNTSEDVVEEEIPRAVAVSPGINCKEVCSPIDINLLPDASDSQTDVHSALFVEDPSNNAKPAEPLTIKGGIKPEKLANSIDIVNVASALDFNVQEARTDIDGVIKLVKEVSDLRAKAEQERVIAQFAESEAARGGEDLLMKACEVNKQTQKMKQDNSKLSREIHGEKSVLAMEVEELSVLLEKMKQQREKVVTTLHELQDTLQSCYDNAHEERKMAEEDKKLKEEKAGKVLEQEEEMRMVVEQETKTLKMESETCTLLRDFLVDHRSIADALQGEFNNLCEDVKDLKEQVQDMRSSMNVAKNQALAQNAGGLYNLGQSSCSLSTLLSSEMSAGQYMDTNHRGKPQFLYSSGTDTPSLSRPLDGTTGDGSFSYVNGGLSSNINMPGHELPFSKNFYQLNVAEVLPSYRHGASHPHPAHNGRRSVASVDPNVFGLSPPYESAFGAHVGDFSGYGYPQEVGHLDHAFAEHEGLPIDLNNHHFPQAATTDWSWKLDYGQANYLGSNDWILPSKEQGSTPSGSEHFSLV